MPTPLELKLIHMAYRQAGLEEEHYRMILRNVAGVESAKLLSQTDLENVMAVLEDSGFRHAGKPADYWRSKVALRGSICGERMVRKIEDLAAGQKYDLAGLCRRVSAERVARVDKLMPREAYQLIEALKAICARQAKAGAGDQSSRESAESNRPGGGRATARPSPTDGPACQAAGIPAAESAGGSPEGRVEAGTASESIPETAGFRAKERGREGFAIER